MSTFRRHAPFLLLLAAFMAVFFWFLNLGDLGHDYFYFFPKLLDGKWHFLRQGLAPFWYTPHFCGGIPQYGNPQSLFYSMPQFFALFLDLWLSVQLAMGIALIIGYVGWYRFARDVMHLAQHWAHVLALIVIAHGFYFVHMLPGHLVFHSMSFLGLLLWILLNPAPDNVRSLLRKAALFGLVSAYILYSGGYMVGVMGMFAFVSIAPLVLIIRSREGVYRVLRVYGVRWVVCGVIAILASLSKLVAIWSFMRFFPREMPIETVFPDGVWTLDYILRAFFVFPQSDNLFWKFGMPEWSATHEYSMMISPVVLIGLILGVILLWKHRREFSIFNFQFSISIAYSFLLIFFFTQLTRGHGFIVTALRSLPVFKSLHMPMRYLYAFSFVLIDVGVWSLVRWVRGSKWASHEYGIAIAMSTVTFAAFVAGYLPLLYSTVLARTMPYNTIILESFDEHAGFQMNMVSEAMDLRGMGHAGFVPILNGANEIYCHEPVFLGSSSLPDNMVAGPVDVEREDDTFNLRNPACMAYPEENRCEMGERISMYDAANFERFRRGLATSWKISTLQHISNWVTLITLTVCILIFVPWKRVVCKT